MLETRRVSEECARLGITRTEYRRRWLTRATLKWREKNIDRYNETSRLAQHRRRSRKLTTPDTLTKKQWKALVKSYSGACAYCSKPWGALPQLDHVVAVSRLGGTTLENVVPSCRRCNSIKSSGTVADAAGRIGFDETQFWQKQQAMLARTMAELRATTSEKR